MLKIKERQFEFDLPDYRLFIKIEKFYDGNYYIRFAEDKDDMQCQDTDNKILISDLVEEVSKDSDKEQK